MIAFSRQWIFPSFKITTFIQSTYIDSIIRSDSFYMYTHFCSFSTKVHWLRYWWRSNWHRISAPNLKENKLRARQQRYIDIHTYHFYVCIFASWTNIKPTPKIYIKTTCMGHMDIFIKTTWVGHMDIYIKTTEVGHMDIYS